MTDTKALRGMLNARSISRAKVNLEKSDCSGGSKVIINKVLNALPDLLDAYEERDRLKAALVQIANYGRGEFPSLNNMADGFNAVQKIAEEALEPKRIIATPESEASND